MFVFYFRRQATPALPDVSDVSSRSEGSAPGSPVKHVKRSKVSARNVRPETDCGKQDVEEEMERLRKENYRLM